MIYLTEIRGLNRDGTRRKPRWTPAFTDDAFAELKDTPADTGYAALTRYGCKMATGSGKTVVMAMLISWAFCNRARVPSDDRFPRAALVVCPNLTIKERLQVLRTDSARGNYYTDFDILPSLQYGDLLRSGKVMVTNWHAFASESEHSESGKSYAVVHKGEEDDDFLRQARLGRPVR